MTQVLEPVSRRTLSRHALLREACRLRVADGDLRAALNRLCHLAAQGVAGVDAVSVVVGPPGVPELLASSSSAAQTGDGLQHLAGSGPTFDAFDEATVVVTGRLFADQRWPRLEAVPAAQQVVVRAVAVPLLLEEQPDEVGRGVITFYAGPVTAPDRDIVDQALTFGAVAEALVREWRTTRRLAEENAQLRDGLTSRAVIDQAKGMIMLAQQCDADRAFAVLQRLSSTSGRKIREVAQDVVARRASQGQSPGSGPGKVRRQRRP